MEARKAVAERLGWEIHEGRLLFRDFARLSGIECANQRESEAFNLCVSLQERVDELEKALAEKNAIIDAAYRGCHCGSDPEWKRIGHKPTCWKALHFAFSQPKPSTEPGGVK